jgi:pimeloyl-ACP methyl ester carboxylesterase
MEDAKSAEETLPKYLYSLEETPQGSPLFLRNMVFLAGLAKMAYNLQKHTGKPYGDGKLFHFDFGVTRGLIFDSPSVLVVTFTGSQTRQDWISNLDIRVVRTPFGTVHRGFIRSFNDAVGEVMPFLRALSAMDKPVILCGHSRGGALAMVLAMILHVRGTRVHAVYTFCSPKVGFADFHEYWHKTGIPLHPVINERDIVSDLPPGSWWQWLRLLFYVIPRILIVNGVPALFRKLMRRKADRPN